MSKNYKEIDDGLNSEMIYESMDSNAIPVRVSNLKNISKSQIRSNLKKFLLKYFLKFQISLIN